MLSCANERGGDFAIFGAGTTGTIRAIVTANDRPFSACAMSKNGELWLNIRLKIANTGSARSGAEAQRETSMWY